MTARKARVLWIDDDPERQKDAENLSDEELTVEFKCEGLNFSAPGALREIARYDLLLVDYRLEKLPDQTIRYMGPAVLGLLRSVDDDTPAYLVSAQGAADLAKFPGLSGFEEFLKLAELQGVLRMRERLKDDVAGYRAIAAIRRRTNADAAILDLLRVPKASQPFLLEAVPSSVKQALVRSPTADVASGSPELPGRLGFARWVRRTLLQKAGPLLPSLHAATRVGMKEPRFRETRAFDAALYKGIFSKSHDRRWWAATIDGVVLERQRRLDLPPGLPWELGPKVFRLQKSDVAKCVVCGEAQPEIVARDTDTEREVPVHQRHSTPAPQRDFTPFFAEERVVE